MEQPTPDLPVIFDRRLIRSRRRRFAASAPGFLLDHALDGLSERLRDIAREFSEICILGDGAGAQGILRSNGWSGRIVSGNGTESDDPSFVADAEFLPLAPRRAECIVSLLDLHMVNDLPGALVQVERALKADGLFLGVMLGSGSLHELRDVFLQAESEIAGGATPRVAPFADVRELGNLLQRAGLALPVVDAETLTVRYPHMLELIRDLRHMGWANPLMDRSKSFMSRAVLLRAGELYGERFSDPDGRIRATFVLTWLTGWSPHESQQKPARRGSAEVSLATVLGAASDTPDDRSD